MRRVAQVARIVADILDREQVAWIRSHHERPDERGYPDGLIDIAGGRGAASTS
jgi:HD-GYP domain-containing protein (c-di-GMP phosphodiesterase class II)